MIKPIPGTETVCYVAEEPERWLKSGRPVDNGQCVRLVQVAAGVPVTSTWRKGATVRGAETLDRGTIIATFDAAGRYPNNAHGNHAAIYLSQDGSGLTVIDQWTGQPPHQRQIRFNGGEGSASNDGDRFSVVATSSMPIS